jgi:hypothetical protein
VTTTTGPAQEPGLPHRYRLVDETGVDLGPLASRRSSWAPGDEVARRHGERLLVVEVVEAFQGDVRAYIVVRNLAR